MKKIYITGMAAISLQKTFDTEDFLSEYFIPKENKAKAAYPDYKPFISPAAGRRMATGVKMGVAAAKKALEEAGNPPLDAIITGTGMGCIEDTEKFLNTILTHDEEYLTPTAFIQSTHNTVGGQIALALKCQAYNTTYVNGASSFESALDDALLTMRQDGAKNVLVGGVDELGREFVDYVRTLEAASGNGIQTPFGEGASFFCLSEEKVADTLGEIKDVQIINTASEEEIKRHALRFLERNALQTDAVDACIFGYNGDAFDSYYSQLSATCFKEAVHLQYKHLVGEYHTASAFGLWAGALILRRQQIPEALLMNTERPEQLRHILLYNQFKGWQHSFILLGAC